MQKGPMGGWGGGVFVPLLAEAWLLEAIPFTCSRISRRGKKCKPLGDG